MKEGKKTLLIDELQFLEDDYGNSRIQDFGDGFQKDKVIDAQYMEVRSNFRYKPIIIQIETEERLNVKLIPQVFILDCLKTDERHKISTIKMIILLFKIQCFFG